MSGTGNSSGKQLSEHRHISSSSASQLYAAPRNAGRNMQHAVLGRGGLFLAFNMIRTISGVASTTTLSKHYRSHKVPVQVYLPPCFKTGQSLEQSSQFLRTYRHISITQERAQDITTCWMKSQLCKLHRWTD